MKKILRSTLYVLMVLCMGLMPDAWLWLHGVNGWVLPLKMVWWIPTVLLLLAEVGLQLGKWHREAVGMLFTMILFSVFPKVVFILFFLFVPWWLALVPSTVAVAWFLYGFLYGWNRLEVKQVEYASPDLPPYFDGYRVLHLSDFHLGTFPHGNGFVEKVVERAIEEEADLVVFTGDLVNNSASEAAPYVETLNRLGAPDGVFSIWGNHDYCEYDNNHSLGALRRNRRELFAYEEQMGWRQLMNEHVTVSHGLASIEIIGVENAGTPPFANRSDLARAMKGIPEGAFKILLTHDPHHWRREALSSGIQLTLSGHTHAGQIRLGRITPARLAFREWGGTYKEGGQMLYVSAGLGGSLPFRLGAWPEMTVITLKRKASC